MNYMDNAWRHQWNRRLAEMMGALRTPGFPDLLVEGLRGLVGFRHAVIFGYPPDRRPVFLHNALGDTQRQGAVTAYIRGSYLVDPFYEACCKGIASGIYRMEDLAPDEFYAVVGAHPGYVSPCVSSEPGVLSEEIGFFAGGEDGYYVVLSLMRDSDEPPFSETEMVVLREIEPVVCSALITQFHAPAVAGAPSADGAPQRDFDGVMAELCTGGITERERQVARLILCGHSTESIARNLGIAAPTVKIHRRNLYAKLNLSTQAELFAMVLGRLIDLKA